MRDPQGCRDGRNHRLAWSQDDIHPMRCYQNDLGTILRHFVQALQSSGAVEVINSNAYSLTQPIDSPDHTSAMNVRVRVLDESLWYTVVAEVATAVRTVPGVMMILKLDRESELDLDVSPWVTPAVRRQRLSAALTAGTAALLRRTCSADEPSKSSQQAHHSDHRSPPGERRET